MKSFAITLKFVIKLKLQINLLILQNVENFLDVLKEKLSPYC